MASGNSDIQYLKMVQMTKKILAIIPARAGSKGLQRKNVIDLAGKPLIAWSIEASLKSKYISKTLVSSDDNEILNIQNKEIKTEQVQNVWRKTTKKEQKERTEERNKARQADRKADRKTERQKGRKKKGSDQKEERKQ